MYINFAVRTFGTYLYIFIKITVKMIDFNRYSFNEEIINYRVEHLQIRSIILGSMIFNSILNTLY